MPGYEETQNLMGNDAFQRLMRAKYDLERIQAEHNAASIRSALPSVGGGNAEPADSGLSWFNKGSAQRDFAAENTNNAAFIARYGMSPQDILEGYRVGNLMADSAPEGSGNPITDLVNRVNADPSNFAPASSQVKPPMSPNQGPRATVSTGTARDLGASVFGDKPTSFAGFAKDIGESPDALTSGYDVGQRFDSKGNLITAASVLEAVNITRGQKAKAEKLARITGAPLALTEARTDAETAKAAAASAKATASTNPATVPMKPTEGQKAVDRSFGKEYADYIAGGGFADVKRQIATLEGVLGKLESGKGNLTGPAIGMIPDGVRAVSNPASMAAQQDVEQSIQRALRQTLGAQFTEKEGETFMKRGYDPRLPEKENAKKLRAMLGQLREMAQAKADASDYYEKNGTLAGYKGKIYTLRNGEMVEGSVTQAEAGMASAKKDPLGLGI